MSRNHRGTDPGCASGYIASIPGITKLWNGVKDAVSGKRAVNLCGKCRSGQHARCTGQMRLKHFRGFAPCECHTCTRKNNVEMDPNL